MKVAGQHYTPQPLGRRTRVSHRETHGFRALCGRPRCDIYPACVLPDSKITCPDCRALLRARKP